MSGALPKDYRQMLQPFLALGFRLEPRRRSTHMAVLDPAGRIVTVLPCTPSDHRSLLNTRAELRRAMKCIGRGLTP